MAKYIKKHCVKHCIIDFKNKIIKTYDEGIDFRYDPLECTYLVDTTIIHTDEEIKIFGSEVHYRYANDGPVKLSDIDGIVKESCIKKSGTSKLEKWLGCEEYEYVSGIYYVKYNNQTTEFTIPKDTFIFKHTNNNKK